MFFSFLLLIKSVPIISNGYKCTDTQQTLDLFSLECVPCPSGTISKGIGECGCSTGIYSVGGTGLCITPPTSPTYKTFRDLYVIDNGVDGNTSSKMLFNNVLKTPGVFNDNYRQLPQIVDSYYNDIGLAVQICSRYTETAGSTNAINGVGTACNALINLCALSAFNNDAVDCRNLFSLKVQSSSSYMTEWQSPGIFYKFTKNTILTDPAYLSAEYNYQNIINLTFARYLQDGTFVDFKNVSGEFNQCGGQNMQTWKQFGTNFYSTCSIKLDQFNITLEPNYMYDLFLYNNQNPKPIIPIPVIIQNNINTGDSLYRRFFVYDSQSNPKFIQFARNITLNFVVQDESSSRMLVPRLFIEYAQVAVGKDVLSDVFNELRNVDFDPNTSILNQQIYFTALYTRSLSSFWRTTIIIFAIFAVLALAFWIFRSVLYAKFHSDDGTLVAHIIAYFFNTFGFLLAFTTFIVSFFVIFIFYKFQTTGYMCLPPEEEFFLLVPIVWTSFALMFVASVILIVLQTRNRVLIIDWETPYKKDAPISAWRRIMLANEWNRVAVVRCYSISFTLIVFIFIFEGFNVDLIAAPVPYRDLIDIGKTYKILRFAFVAFLWIIFMVFEYIVNFAFMFMANPFMKFLDLCTMANCSVLVLTTKTNGFYLHGRSIFSHADESMEKMNSNLQSEGSDTVGLRGLAPNSTTQVFRVYLHPNLGNALNQSYQWVLDRTSKRFLSLAKQINAKTKAASDAYGTYDKLNRFVKKFLDSSEESRFKYVFQDSTFVENFMGWGPQLQEDSIFTNQRDDSYKSVLMDGIQWNLCLLDMLLYAGVDMHTESPAIAAFVVFIVDLCFVKLYQFLSRKNITRKAVVDPRFILS